MDYKKKYEAWLHDEHIDASIRKELADIEGDEAEIEDRFYSDIQFGTAGLRGVIRAGSNSMNLFNVQRASQALAQFIKEEGFSVAGVVIGYDSRHMSREFAEATARVLTANGVKAYLFKTLVPVPLLSFAIRFLGCAAGVEITASHNPAQYNGYKAYAAYGGQLAPEDCRLVMSQMQLITKGSQIKSYSMEEARISGLLVEVGDEVLDAYVEGVKALQQHPRALKGHEDMPIVYTPLHGAGDVPVRRVLSEIGFTNVQVVPEQQKPDGAFPTVSAPNPENPQALELAVELAQQIEASIVLASDPDADRFAVAIPVARDYLALNGNQAGALLLDYVLRGRASHDNLPPDGLVCKSIVSTNLANRICESYGVECTEVLTGFRFISEQIVQAELQGCEFLFAFEESFGCLCGNLSRDKDAVLACMLLCEASAYYQNRGMTLRDALEGLYQKHGYYLEASESYMFEGAKGQAEMASLLRDLRERPAPTELGGLKVLAVRDYEAGLREVTGGGAEPIHMPPANVLYYELEGDSWLALRPSGTEPKLKIYFAAGATSMNEAGERLEALMTAGEALIGR